MHALGHIQMKLTESLHLQRTKCYSEVPNTNPPQLFYTLWSCWISPTGFHTMGNPDGVQHLLKCALCREHGHGSHYDYTRTEWINGLGTPGIPKGAHLGPSPSPQNTCRLHGQAPMNHSEVLKGWKFFPLLYSQSSIASPESQLGPFQHHKIDFFRAVWYADNLPHTLLKMGMTNPVCLSTDTVPDIHMTLKRYVNQRQSHIVSQFFIQIHTLHLSNFKTPKCWQQKCWS